MVIGITGSIATGKTFVTEYLRKKHYYVIDADEISREATKKDCICYKEIVEVFGSDILKENQDINRQKLAQIIFSDTNKKKILENIIHPVVVNEILNQIKKSKEKNIFVSIPLLYEVGFEKYLDKIVVVYLDEETQIERLMKRDNITKEYALDKIGSQYSIKEKIKKCDYVIDNSGTKEKTIELIEKFIETIEE